MSISPLPFCGFPMRKIFKITSKIVSKVKIRVYGPRLKSLYNCVVIIKLCLQHTLEVNENLSSKDLCESLTIINFNVKLFAELITNVQNQGFHLKF